MRPLIVGLCLLLGPLGAPAQAARNLAFPGAVGFAAETFGGRGGDVFLVTTLADDGPRSLCEGIDSQAGPRMIDLA